MSGERHKGRVVLDRAVIGGRIRERLKQRGWTTRKLAERAGVDDSCLNLIERGIRGGTLDTFARIAIALRETVDRILFGETGGRAVVPADAAWIDAKAMGGRIRKVRLSRKGSHRAMATACGVPIAEVRGWERGMGAIPDAAELVRLAIYLRRSIDFVLCGVSRRGALWRMAAARAKKTADAAKKAAT